MLSVAQTEILRDRVYELLWSEGMRIKSDEMVSVLMKKGCSQAASGRIRFPKELIDEMAAYQKKNQQLDDEDQKLHYRCGIDWAHHIIWHGQQKNIWERLQSEFLMPAFDCGPTTYYDYPTKSVKPVDTDIFIEMMKFAQSTPEIGYISTWYRQDVPQETERIESLILGLRHTTPAEVRQKTERLVQTVGNGGGYIVCPAHAIQPDTPVENIVALYETANPC